MHDTATAPTRQAARPDPRRPVAGSATPRPAPVPAPRPDESDTLTQFTAVICGLGTAWSVYPHGGGTLGHGVLLLIWPVVAGAVWRHRQARILLAFLTVWLLAAVFTEVLTGDTAHHTAYALSRPITVGLSFCGGLWLFEQRPGTRVAQIYAVSLLLGIAAAVVLYPATEFADQPWKLAFGPVVSIAAAMLSAVMLGRGARTPALLLMTAVAFVNLRLGFRSEFLNVSLATTVGVLATRRSQGQNWKRCLLVAGCLCALTTAVYTEYGQLAGSGQLGAQQQLKWDRQSQIKGGLLIGARPELLASSAVIEASPLFGRGVAPQVDSPTREAFLERLRGLGVTIHDGVPAYYFGHGLYLHSIVFQLWAETGLLVLPGLLFPIVLVLRALFTAVRAGSGAPALIFSLLLAHLGWDLLFSPWPRLEGVYLGTAAAAALVYLMRQRLPDTVSGRRTPTAGRQS